MVDEVKDEAVVAGSAVVVVGVVGVVTSSYTHIVLDISAQLEGPFTTLESKIFYNL